MGKKRKRKGFTLIELMVVILIVGILAAVAVPILRGKIEAAKWSEGAATAGAIRSAARARFAEAGAAGVPVGAVLTDVTAATLGFQAGDLTGRYFAVGQFTISSIDLNGIAVIAVSAPATLNGSGTLDATGWTYTPP